LKNKNQSDPEMTQKQEEEKPLTFAERWKLDKEFGSEDYKTLAETFFDNGKKLGWPEELIDAFIGLCAKLENLDEYYTDNFASKDSDVKPLLRKLEGHKHLPDGQAVEPL